jgi:erythrin-vacuolar iron transport family protein
VSYSTSIAGVFGDHIPLIRREDVKGFITRKPVWLIERLGINTVRRYAESIEAETQCFYERAAALVRGCFNP